METNTNRVTRLSSNPTASVAKHMSQHRTIFRLHESLIQVSLTPQIVLEGAQYAFEIELMNANVMFAGAKGCENSNK